MDNSPYKSYKIEDRSYLSFIKREIHNSLVQAGFSNGRTGEIDIIVAELTSNLIKHAGTGELVYRIANENGSKAFEIICFDNGQGTNDIQRMMKDGLSSSNTLGQGLGAINRLSNFFQIYSFAGWGTVAYSKSYFTNTVLPYKKPVGPELNLKAVQLCYPGEKVCGDGYYCKKSSGHTQLFLGDGLGHGPHAYEAVSLALEAFKSCEETEPELILQHIDQHVKKTRGLVGTVAVLDHTKKQWRICGVGNITTRMYEGLECRNIIPYNGIIGLNMPPSISSYTMDEQKYQCVIMFTDGIKNRWDLSKYPSILKYDPAVIASIIFKENARRNDDMTILVGKVNN